MSISYLLVALGLGVFVLAVWALFWAIDAGQYEDLEKAASSILVDEDEKKGTDPFNDDEDIGNK